jgi:alanine dehydrogenase
MPGAVARTATQALNNATLPYVIKLADEGYMQALGDDPHLLAGLNLFEGRVTYEAVARDLGLPYTPAEQALGLC